MDEATTFATKAELEQVKEEQKRMANRLVGIDAALTSLTNSLTKEVADLSEMTERRFDELETRIAEGNKELETRINAGNAELARLIEDRHRTLISAVMAPRRK